MLCCVNIRKIIYFIFILIIILLGGVCIYTYADDEIQSAAEEEKKYIKWVDFNIPYEVLEKAMNIDIKSQKDEMKLSWIEILSHLSTKYGGDYKRYKAKDMDDIVAKIKEGKTAEEISKNQTLYNYYIEAYTAVLGEFLGNYKIQTTSKDNPEEKTWVDKYGLKVFSPVARGYYYNHYDDFGVSRSYGYNRRHLGHDMMGSIGTPIIAIESGIVEAVGWNQYGGWRIGIRSFDKKRYYYYAHLRKDTPYHADIVEGKVVKAGDVIGYLGRTGYSVKENVNNITQSHLHVGMQVIFDEVQKDGVNQIWIDFYAITKLLEKNRSYVMKNGKEFDRVYDFHEELLDNRV